MKGALGKKPEPVATPAKAGGAAVSSAVAKGSKDDLRKLAGAVGFAAGSKMLAPSGASAAKAGASETPAKTTTVSKSITDGPYGWMSKFDVAFSDKECQLSVKVKLEAQEGVSPEDVQKVATESSAAFTQYFDNKFKLTDASTKKVFPLRTSVSFVQTGEHLVVKLRKGEGRDNLSNWFVKSQGIVRAHELGHQIGIKDEYIDAGAENRKDASAPGVKTDNSLMGNFWTEGVGKAKVKQRHAQDVAGLIGGGTGGSYTAAAME